MRIRPAPRRAVGPDLVDTVIAARGGLGPVTRAHLVARALVSEHPLAFVFADSERAQRAAAWLCGRGVRPLRMLVEGETLYLQLAEGSTRHAAAVQVVQELARELGGEPVAAPVFPGISGSTPAAVDLELLELLGRELRRA